MGKPKTQRNIDAAGKKKRASLKQKEALQKAQMARRMRAAMKRAAKEAPVQEHEGGVAIQKHPDLPQPISKVEKDFLKETVDYCLERINKHREGAEIQKPPRLACHHHLTLGSSYVGRLLDGTLSVDKLHRRAYYRGAQGDGAYWEDIVGCLGAIDCDGVTYSVLRKVKTPLGVSYRYPWLVATPDFIMRLKSSQGEFYGVVEVKSTECARTFNSSMKEYVLQVQAALEVFNLDAGFMVVYLVDNADKTIFNEKIVKIARNKLFEDPQKLSRAYSRLVQGIMHESLNAATPEDVIYEAVTQMTNVFTLPSSFEEVCIKLPRYSVCLMLDSGSHSKHLARRPQTLIKATPLAAHDYHKGGYCYKKGGKNVFAPYK